MKKFLAAIVAVTMSVSLAACGSSSNSSASTNKKEESTNASTDDKVYKIGVLQLTQHAALDKCNEGFFAALDEAGIKYEADQQNASGEQSACQTIAEKLVNDKNDLIYAIATPAAQAVAGVTSEIPVVLSAVTDPAESGLVASNDAPGTNVTGTSDLTPVKEQIELLKRVLPEAKTVGILYCSAESNSEIQAAMARKACEDNGLAYVDFIVSSSNEIQTVVESMVGKVDAIYAPTDNTIATGMATVSMIATDNNLPIICGEGGMVDAGGLASYGIDYYQLGYKAGQMAIQILTEGADPATMPIGYLAVDQCELTVNEETAKALNIDVSSIK